MNIAHIPLRDNIAIQYIDTLFKNLKYEDLEKLSYTEFDNAWRKWLTSETYNNIVGLDQFKYSAFSPGTTDSFGEFISRYRNRRIRVSKSDFVLTKILCRTYERNLCFLENDLLQRGDILIMSFPFSGNGSYHPKYENVLDTCDTLDIPVFVDGAYFGISSNMHYPLQRDCVKDFSVSLSKNLAGNSLRLGIRFTKDEVDDGMTAGLLGSDVYDRLGAYISIKLLEKFSHKSVVDRHINNSNKICLNNNLTPTNTFTIGIGTPEMEEFKRGDYVRVCISEELSKLT